MAVTVTKLRNFIGGKAVEPAEGGMEDVVNPATGSAIASAPLSTKTDVDAAAAAAKGAFDGWAATTPGEPTGVELVTHPDVEMVSLTGSPPTGKWIAKAAADTLKRVHLELGGKAPVVVFDDVDIGTALETIAGTGYYNAGQDCTAATRVLAAKGVYDDVVNSLDGEAKGLVP